MQFLHSRVYPSFAADASPSASSASSSSAAGVETNALATGVIDPTSLPSWPAGGVRLSRVHPLRTIEKPDVKNVEETWEGVDKKLTTATRGRRPMRHGGKMRQIEDEHLADIKKRKRQYTCFDFRAGDFIAVKMYQSLLGGKKKRVVAGMCLGRKRKGMNSMFYLRVYAMNHAIEYILPLYSPWIIDIILLRTYQRRPRNKVFFYREKPAKFFKVRVPEDFLQDAVWLR